MAKAIPVVVFGVKYRSRLQACKAFYQNPGKIDHRLRGGMTLEVALISPDKCIGAKKHPLYSHWNGMRSRCYSRSACSKRYIGRVEMCKEWRDSFWLFVKDMRLPPGDGYSIDRIDNSEGYYKENCRWATRTQQQRNMRSNVFVECFGQRKTLSEWAEHTGLSSDCISHRINKQKLPPEIALTKKSKKASNTSRIKNEENEK